MSFYLFLRQKNDKATRLNIIGKPTFLFFLNLLYCRWKNQSNLVFLFLVFWPEGEKLQWFQSQLDPEKTSYTRKDACEIIERSKLFIY